jgi:glc operon protein GlcG
MKPCVLAVVVLSASLLGAATAHAQPAPAANPLDVIPDKMPFDVPYGAPIGLDRAQSVIAAAVAEAKKHDWKEIVAVVDSGGNLVAMARMDGAQLASVTIAEHKARTAATFRRDTKLFETNVDNGLVYQLSLDGIIASRGGIPLVEGGKLIGAIGVSGGAGSQDEVCAKAGAATVK